MSDTRRLLSNTSILFAGTLTSGAFAYLFNVSAGRLLGPESYGEVSAILSIFTVVSVAGGAFTMIAMRYGGELYFSQHYQALRRAISLLTSQVFGLAALLFALGCVLIIPISHFFGIHTPVALVIAFSSFFASFALLLNRGFLQGTQHFALVSLSTVIEMVTRFSLLLIFYRLGFGINGAITAIFMGSLISYLATLPSMRKLTTLTQTEDGIKKEESLNVKEILRYGAPSLLTSVFLTIFMTMDVLLVKHYFSDQQAGQYAAISALAKIIFYLTGPIVSAMFPMIAERRAKGEKHYQTFLLSIGITSVGTLCAVGVYAVMPHFLVKLLYGPTYLSYADLLPKAGLYILFYALINLFANYYMAIQDTTFLYLFGFMLIVEIVAVHFYHPSVAGMVSILISTMGSLFALMVLRYVVLKRTQLLQLLNKQYGLES